MNINEHLVRISVGKAIVEYAEDMTVKEAV